MEIEENNVNVDEVQVNEVVLDNVGKVIEVLFEVGIYLIVDHVMFYVA